MSSKSKNWLFQLVSSRLRLGLSLLVVLAITVAVWVIAGTLQQSAPALTVHVISRAEIAHGDAKKKQIIFTFDGGASGESGTAILDALAKHHVTGTFFLTGRFVESNPALVQSMVDEGHEIFNHTYDHPHLTQMPDEEIYWEFSRMEKTLIAAVGVSPKPYFRPPYGDVDDRVRAAAFKAGYESVYWTVDARDWMFTEGETDQSVEDRILSTAAPGNIYLMHLGDPISGSILDDVFTKLEARGYKLVSLTQGL